MTLYALRLFRIYIDVSSTFRDRVLKNGIIRLTDCNSKLEPITYHLNSPGTSLDFDLKTGLTRIVAPIPGDLPPGDYSFKVDVTVEDSAVSNELRVIVAPSKAYVPEPMEQGRRVAGIAISLYGCGRKTTGALVISRIFWEL